MGMERLTIKTIKQVPVVFGEADVLKAVLALPGVTSVGEGSSGYNVRGGSTDQNLIRLQDILGEQRRQLDSLERQAQRAERYRDQLPGHGQVGAFQIAHREPRYSVRTMKPK